MSPETAGSALRRSSSSRRVIALRERLLRAGITVSYLHPSEVDDPTVFDDHVDAAVRAFQQSRGLLVDGLVGPETQNALSEAQYQLGDRPLAASASGSPLRGEDVAELQRQLSFLGFYYGHIDGVFSERTTHAVTEMQRNLGLPENGVCDGSMITAMARVSRSLTPSHAVSLRDYERLAQASSALRDRIILLSPGSDVARSGAVKDPETEEPLKEDKVTRDIVRRVRESLESFGATVVEPPVLAGADHTPPPDSTDRPSLSVAVHCDWLHLPVANGVSAYYWGVPETMEIRSPIGRKAAGLIMREIVARTDMADLGVHGRSWDKLRMSAVPSVRVDVGYLSNPGDCQRLADHRFRQVVADSIVIGIQRLYLQEEEDRPTGSLNISDVLSFNPDA
jgi:N-acetylmuramoyl-L-alanine amidase